MNQSSTSPHPDHLVAHTRVSEQMTWSGWAMTLYPTAGEATGQFVSQRRPGSTGIRGAAQDQERSDAEAAARARRIVRRYCAANGLNRLGTLTYRGAGCHNPGQFRIDVAAFFRLLRSLIGGTPFPYLWVPELHPGGHGLHGHFAVGRFIKRRTIEAAWPHGFVHIKLLGDLPVGSTARDEARRAAGYLSKYVAKSFDEPVRDEGGHRYDVAEGFRPASENFTAASAEELRALANERMAALPRREWSSRESPEWRGPHTVWLQWP